MSKTTLRDATVHDQSVNYVSEIDRLFLIASNLLKEEMARLLRYPASEVGTS